MVPALSWPQRILALGFAACGHDQVELWRLGSQRRGQRIQNVNVQS